MAIKQMSPVRVNRSIRGVRAGPWRSAGFRRVAGLFPFHATIRHGRGGNILTSFVVRGGAYYERPCSGDAGSPPGSNFPTPSARAHADVLDPILRALAGVADPRRIVESVAPRHTF